jgi:hypothetical protein
MFVIGFDTGTHEVVRSMYPNSSIRGLNRGLENYKIWAYLIFILKETQMKENF